MPPTCAVADLWIATRRVSALLEREAERVLGRELGLSTTTYALLSTLSAHPDHITQQAIADLLGLTKSSISRHMDAATAAGYIAPAAQPSSRRDRAVELTPLGREAVRRADDIVERIVPSASDDADVAAATRALAAVSARLVAGTSTSAP